ncbi:MAG: hypothetical protein GY835_13700 [bacterium]|nr:hypothetical protein [bacterium]
MIQRIHILGASGSGTTTLARAIASATSACHLDTDDFFWIKTTPPFRTIREVAVRQELLRQALAKTAAWTLSGSLCGWGDFAIPLFDLVVFLTVPRKMRMQRLLDREIARYGAEIEDPDDPRHETHRAFLDWAAAYDKGGPEIRSRSMHEDWLAQLPRPALRIEGDQPVEESLHIVLSRITSLGKLNQ